jgi:hypothetical protein
MINKHLLFFAKKVVNPAIIPREFSTVAIPIKSSIPITPNNALISTVGIGRGIATFLAASSGSDDGQVGKNTYSASFKLSYGPATVSSKLGFGFSATESSVDITLNSGPVGESELQAGLHLESRKAL